MVRKYAIRIRNSKANLDELHFTEQDTFSFATSIAYNLCYDKIIKSGESWRVVEVLENFNKKDNK